MNDPLRPGHTTPKAMAQDLYSVLGVSRDASKDEIKKAYRSLAVTYHPDRNRDKGAEDKFKNIQRAYNVLSDDNKRATYDQFGEAGLNGAGTGSFDRSSFEDIFDSLFGGDGFNPFGSNAWRGHRDSDTRGRNIQVTVAITLEDAVKGINKKMRIKAMSPCSGCSGTGLGKDSRQVECANCGGSGMARSQIALFSIQQTCRECNGSGQKVENPCKECSGKGRIRKLREIDVDIPAGVDTDDTLRLSGQGESGIMGGQPGDLMVRIEIEPNERFRREGDNITCELPVEFTTAVLGGKIKIPTLEGHEVFDLPKGIQNGKVIKIKGKGIKGIRSPTRGDLYARIILETPTHLTADQVKLVRELDKSLKKNPNKHYPKRDGWLKRAKKLFS